jgi:hypothetical protein
MGSHLNGAYPGLFVKCTGKVQIYFRAATIRERVVTRKWHRTKKRISHPLAHARGSV